MTDTELGIIAEGWTFVHIYTWPTVIMVVIRGRALVIEDGLGTEMGRFSSAAELGAELRRLDLDPKPALAALAPLQFDPEPEAREQEGAQTSLLRAAWGPYQYKRVLDRLFPDDGSEPDGG